MTERTVEVQVDTERMVMLALGHARLAEKHISPHHHAALPLLHAVHALEHAEQAFYRIGEKSRP